MIRLLQGQASKRSAPPHLIDDSARPVVTVLGENGKERKLANAWR